MRKVSSSVQKWQTIEQQAQQPEIMDGSESEEEDQQISNARMIEEWKHNQMQRYSVVQHSYNMMMILDIWLSCSAHNKINARFWGLMLSDARIKQ